MQEKENNKRNKNTVGLIILILLIGGYSYFKINGEQSAETPFQDNGQKLSEDIISCQFGIVSNFTYKNKKDLLSAKDQKVYYETTKSETPNLITFVGLSSSEPKIKGNNGDNPVTIFKNDSESIILIERNSFGDMFTYTIFKKEKVAVWHKAYKVVTIPYTLVSMGPCY